MGLVNPPSKPTGQRDNIDLSPSQREELQALLQRYLPNTEVWAYGSRVTFDSQARHTSDFDMVAFIIPEQKTSVSHLREALEESNLPFTVYFLIWDDIPERFKPNILQAYFVMQEKNEETSPPEWRQVKLGDIANVSTGKSNSQDASINGYYPLFDRSSIIKKSNKYIFDCKAVIVPGEGKEFIPRIFSGKFDLHQRAYCVTSQNKSVVDTHFLYYCLLENRKYWERVAVGSTVKSLRLNSFTEFPVLLPTRIRYQKAIAHILGTLDDKIELNQKKNETLEEIAKAIFKSWFVDFDPVRAKIEGRPTGLPDDISDLFPDELVDSEIGEIPKGWEISELCSLVSLNAKNWTKKNHPNTVEYLDLGNIKYNKIIETEEYKWDEAPSRARRVLSVGDTID